VISYDECIAVLTSAAPEGEFKFISEIADEVRENINGSVSLAFKRLGRVASGTNAFQNDQKASRRMARD